MKKYAVLYMCLSLFLTQSIWAAGPINFNNATFLKRIKKSIDYPIDLYQSTDPQHANKLFTARVIMRLEQGGVPPGEQASLRNEICANQKIQTANAANLFAQTPGAFGFYKHNESIVAIQDQGLLGEPLNSVLYKLQASNPTSKRAVARKYTGLMRDEMNKIHAADITWNNASLSNFYVLPDGTLTAIDFSSAKNSPGGADTQDKINERLNFLANVVKKMYEILFPSDGANPGANAYDEFSGATGLNNPNWRTANWNQANFNGINPGSAVLIPYTPAVDVLIRSIINPPGAGGVLRADHDAIGLALNHGVNGFVAHPDVIQLLQAAPGAPAWADLIALCAQW